MQNKVKTWAKMYWRTNPKRDPNELSNRVVEFTGRDRADIKQQLNYYIGHYGIVRCEIATGETDETKSTSKEETQESTETQKQKV